MEVNVPAVIISPIGVIDKSNGGIRLIHDCSRPHGQSVNDHAPQLDKQRFESVDCATNQVKPNSYGSTVDLKGASGLSISATIASWLPASLGS